jgi:hypothetical protein
MLLNVGHKAEERCLPILARFAQLRMRPRPGTKPQRSSRTLLGRPERSRRRPSSCCSSLAGSRTRRVCSCGQRQEPLWDPRRLGGVDGGLHGSDGSLAGGGHGLGGSGGLLITAGGDGHVIVTRIRMNTASAMCVLDLTDSPPPSWVGCQRGGAGAGANMRWAPLWPPIRPIATSRTVSVWAHESRGQSRRNETLWRARQGSLRGRV